MRGLVLVVVLLGVLGSAFGQQAVAGSGKQVVLDVVVTDKSGKPVAGLTQGDFTVLDRKQASSIVAFHAHDAGSPAGDAQTQIFLIIDEINADYSRVQYVRGELGKFLRQNQGTLQYPVSLGFFNDGGLQVQTQPSFDGNALAAAMEQQVQGFRAIQRGAGVGGQEDMLQKSLNALDSLLARERKAPGRKVVIWISPGWPLLSGPRTNLTEAQMQRVFNAVVERSTVMAEERMTLYSVDSLGTGASTEHTSYYKTFEKPLLKPGDAQIGDMGLQVQVDQTGGRAIFGGDSVESSLNKCVSDLSAFYTVTIGQTPAEKANEFHEVEVKVGRPGLTARTRDGYYAQP
jgi:VWFA-related protein